ncbi:biotin/lipoyl-containing protein, partial [Acinetobacter baumannii]
MQIKTPDIGVDKANVAEILVKVGDRVEVDDSIVVLESDKATVEVPSTSAGVVKSILINQGDDVTEGVALIEIEAEGAAQPTPAPAAEKPAAPAPAQQTQASAQPAAATSSATVEVTVPDIGVEKALVGEILVKVGDQIDVEQSI